MKYAPVLLLILLGVTSCSSQRTGVPFSEASRKTDAYLTGKVDDGLFDLAKGQAGERSRTFQFTSGRRQDKASFVFPTRVTVILRSRSKGENSSVRVTAVQKGLFANLRNAYRESLWWERVMEAVKAGDKETTR